MANLTSFGRVLAAGTVLALALTACGKERDDDAAAEDTHTIATAYGDVEVPTDPERVVALSYDTPWQLQSLGVRPVATQDYSAYIDEFSESQQDFIDGIDSIGPYGEPDLEKIAAAQPDLIVGDVHEVDEATFEKLAEIAPTAIVGGEERGDWKAIVGALAEAVGAEEELARTTAEYDATLAEVKETYAEQIEGNTWIHFSLGNSEGEFSVQYPSGTTGSLVVDELGMAYGPNVPADPGDGFGYGSYSVEQIPTVFDGVTAALTFENTDGSPNPLIDAIEKNSLFQATEVAGTDRVFHLSVGVTDFATATLWLRQVEERVLSQL
ncbi:ABC transporter substrate-binding protein [Nocardioides caeni]|uniref:ABC transporter substrate-binding protein n=1 Tax=Nocardioides caeni TaxID=574700 RepID=A0A4S8N080_9ACTN|nr:ABC transporter substrate-binding protein [Nocardioides caeni]THV08882.1 ABC transporter substrate-binding protein [Nocardioides caeni]